MEDDPDTGSQRLGLAADPWLKQGIDPAKADAFRRFALVLLVYCIPVLLVGGFVRASLSGDGCGVSWPLCGGSLLPDTNTLKSVIEFSHRISSGLLALGVALLYFRSRQMFEPKSLPRRAAGISLALCLVSALIGAVLVKFSLVVFDKSMARAVVMCLHLVNNYFLLGALLVNTLPPLTAMAWRGPAGGLGVLLKASVVGMFLLAVTGAISAFGKTAWTLEMSAAQSLGDRVAMHLGESAHPLLKGGVLHPFISISVMVIVMVACRQAMRTRASEGVQMWGQAVAWGLFAQMALGVINLLLSAPVWMQIAHLGAAIGLWLSLLMLTMHCGQTEAVLAPEPEPSMDAATQPSFMTMVGQYVALTKPRVISLLLFTTGAAMVIAQGGWPNLWLMLAVMLGGYMAAGAANTFNMVIESDLDLAMGRTASRPTVTHTISNQNALIFAVCLAVGSFALLTWSANILSALLAQAGLAFYVLIYTLVLKRRTWQNIVIGGAAGAFPPLVGYAAVKGELSLFAWGLFALIFFWTPVHFWALAILIKDDYARAGVPMLPVVKGDHATAVQIVFYAVLTGLISILPLFAKEVGPIYIVSAGVLNLILLVQSIQLLMHTDQPRARALFKYSMLYLALMFVAIAVDRVNFVG